ncbi:SDR family oxidoreductase [Prosthecochloris sp. N3]|uniref:SDR family oxidoreductase n=1 Tax=Prosthecochloris ethylica TaxID=2743976 RepID=A0ABR9XS64_9CHLB|nr:MULTISPECIES: SDR family oxidoreductase [Prosthecochloris]MEC9486615.1 SDR family oxidoreductase [Prosthecochloris sp.]MBF0586777.1 SDR family oxidoreductase [Prosthecochloris ethylica]MBF0636683.1 SDR family oxidoreductase [Prosthecochloris ethylica]NUK47918.1 SDR family oxidoreductase [Prosthecochloris ethylica]RNA65220.1 SDR family oxidoreductase [Prosthecochloris sp. ZM_2]
MQKIIVLTGAGKGIGRETALEFARRKNTTPDFDPVLVLCSRTAGDLESLSGECRKLGARTMICEADISRMEDIDKLVDVTMSSFNRIDCLVNNAGVGRFKPLTELTPEDFDYTMSVNARGTFFLTQKVFPIMERQQSGHIFFISSVAAEKAFKSSAIYSMSKYAQNGLVEALRLYARENNIRVTNVMPGAVATPMWGEQAEQLRNVMMMPEDIAAPVVDAFLQPARTTVEELVIRPTGGDINS